MGLRMGRIGYLNVLPIYHPLETDKIKTDCELVYGPPSELNKLMDAGKLDISSCSSIEYARHAEKYYLVPNLAIGSRGPVQSVLLLSRRPVNELDGKSILVSAQTHTSAALLRVLLKELWHVDTEFYSGDATAALNQGEQPEAILAIGDEALNLRFHPEYPHRIDLGESWRELTGLPFIFGVWIVQRESWEKNQQALTEAARQLIAGKDWGTENMPFICALASTGSHMNEEQMCSYFSGLVYDLGEEELKGMQVFYDHLLSHGIINSIPKLEFLPVL